MSLGLKKTVVVDGVKLPCSVDERQPILHGSFKGFKPNRNNHQRVLLIAAWLKINSKVAARPRVATCPRVPSWLRARTTYADAATRAERAPLSRGFNGPNRPRDVRNCAAWQVVTLDMRSMGLEHLEVDFLSFFLKTSQNITTADSELMRP